MLTVATPLQLQAAAEVMRNSPRLVSSAMTDEARREVDARWVSGLQQRASTLQEREVLLPGAGSKHGDDYFTLFAANTTAPLSGGLVPDSEYAGTEFGAIPKTIDVMFKGRSRRQVTGKQFRYRQPDGYLVFPTMRAIASKLVGAWVRGAISGIVKGLQ